MHQTNQESPPKTHFYNSSSRIRKWNTTLSNGNLNVEITQENSQDEFNLSFDLKKMIFY